MPEWLLQVMTAGAGAASVYAAIRADLAALHVKAEQAHQAATRAHERLDTIFANRRS